PDKHPRGTNESNLSGRGSATWHRFHGNPNHRHHRNHPSRTLYILPSPYIPTILPPHRHKARISAALSLISNPHTRVLVALRKLPKTPAFLPFVAVWRIKQPI